MMFRKSFAAVMAVFLFCTVAGAQKAEVTITLNETFFDALLDSIFQNLGPVEFPIAGLNRGDTETQRMNGRNTDFSRLAFSSGAAECKEVVRILRESGGVKTGVRFRQGKISAPLAFSIGYSPPFVGCVEISGWADTTIDLEFDAENQRLIGRARVGSVNVNGTGGVGGSVLAKLVQSAIDKKINPIEIIRLDKLSFSVPVHTAGSLRMKAVAARTEILAGALNIHVSYEFLKG